MSRISLILLAVWFACGPAEHLLAQDVNTGEHLEKVPIPAKDYTFQMFPNPNFDITVKIRVLPKGDDERNIDSASQSVLIQREIRPNVVLVKQNPDSNGKESICYYINGWCALSDSHYELTTFQLGFDYCFPELTWAEPNTRQSDPPVRQGKPQIHLYKEGMNILEVDANSGHPLRYNDGQQEWLYTYKEDSTPIVIPEKFATRLREFIQLPQ